MTKRILLFMSAMLLLACGDEEVALSSLDPVDWEQRKAEVSTDSLRSGNTYLSVYSQVYSLTESKTHDLTATVSMKNPNIDGRIIIRKAAYYNTSGALMRTYFDHPIYIAPMETVEIVIDEKDQSGGTGANFIFDWEVSPGLYNPIFEAVMISTIGQQGLSFTTQGVDLNRNE